MSMPPAMAGTRVLISFSSAYVQLARRLADELRAAGIAVRYDQWEGGGGISARQSVSNDLGDVDFVLPLLTPSDAAPTWVGEEWRQAVYEPALALKILVIPVLAEGDLAAVPLDLQERRFANRVLSARLHESAPPARYRGSPVLGYPEAPRCYRHTPQP